MRVVKIDESRCDGCGLCVKACHEGALALIGGKAVLSNHMLCDGIGDCLPACPQNAISFHETQGNTIVSPMTQIGGPQWPIKLELIAERNPMFDGKSLLVAADCTAFTRPEIINEYCKDGVKIICCPKLGRVDQNKLNSIVAKNDIESITVVRMEVPCCGPTVSKMQVAITESGKDIPLTTIIVSRDGKIRM